MHCNSFVRMRPLASPVFSAVLFLGCVLPMGIDFSESGLLREGIHRGNNRWNKSLYVGKYKRCLNLEELPLLSPNQSGVGLLARARALALACALDVRLSAQRLQPSHRVRNAALAAAVHQDTAAPLRQELRRVPADASGTKTAAPLPRKTDDESELPSVAPVTSFRM